ncbi:MAG: ABC transporter ATP-binding protein [Actinomycetota bacterium]|nr:ABC transporter ATP-binding protein [Actinomycetota bacterium]
MNAIYTKSLGRKFTKRNKTKIALENVDLKIEEGAFYGLLGPNGAGKTTLIKILSTLLLPTTGKAKVLGYDVAKQTNEIRWRMSLVSGGEFSGYGLLTVEEQLWMFALFNGMTTKDAQNKIDQLLEIVNLEEARKIPLSELSTGMRQKMNLVRGLMTDPEILFLDEPTLGLDVEIARDVRTYLKNWISEGKKMRTILLTTHYMQEAEELCEKIGIINEGTLITEGTSSQIKKQSLHSSKFIITTENNYAISRIYPKLNISKIKKNNYEIYAKSKREENEIYQIIRFNKNIVRFDEIKPTLEDAFMSLTGRELI